MEQDYTKPIIAFILVLAGGLAFFISGKFAPPEGNSQYGAIIDYQKLGGYAREVCLKALRDKLQTRLYSPSETVGDGKSYVILSWKPTMESPHAVDCRYEQARGITEIVVDGKPLALQNIDIGGDPNNRGGGSQTESHWGH
jgi:hypothetical protein